MPTPTSTRRSLSSMASLTCVACLSGSSACAEWKRRAQVSTPGGVAEAGPPGTLCVSGLILLTPPVWDEASWACRSLLNPSIHFGCVGRVCTAPHGSGSAHLQYHRCHPGSKECIPGASRNLATPLFIQVHICLTLYILIFLQTRLCLFDNRLFHPFARTPGVCLSPPIRFPGWVPLPVIWYTKLGVSGNKKKGCISS